MTIGVQAFQGERLKQARLARGLYKNALADMVGVTGTAITRYEDGLDKPQADRLDALAAQLKFSVNFFLEPVWLREPEVIFWRSHAAETKLAREMTQQRMLWSCEIFSFLEREVDFPVLQLPPAPVPDDFRQVTAEQIERAAEAVREAWRLWDHPIPDVTLALENAGIPVVHLEVASEKQDGFCFRAPQLDRLFVGVNTHNVSCARARYDVAHELGHAVLHSKVSRQQSRDPAAHKLIEQQAHRFAGAVLFPRSAFHQEVRAPTLDYFCSLKRRWGMSIAAMIYRAFDLHLIDDDERTILYRNLTRRRWRGPLQEPFDDPLVMALEKPRMYRRGFEVVLGEGTYGRATVQTALPLPAKEIEQIVGLEEGYLGCLQFKQVVMAKSNRFSARDLESGKVIQFGRPTKR